MADDIRQIVLGILAHQALIEVADIRLDAAPEDLGLDSLGLVEAIFAIEERFDISVPFNANDPGENRFDISTIGSILDAVEALCSAQEPKA